MQLTKVRVREFKSIWDSNEFEIGKTTCLVGKNEAGKTAILEAMYRLNPIAAEDAVFEVRDDYPRVDVSDYQNDFEQNKRKPAVPVEATFTLEGSELDAIHAEFGKSALNRPEVLLTRGYEGMGNGELRHTLFINESAIARHLVEHFELPTAVRPEVAKNMTLADLAGHLDTKKKTQDAALASAQDAANALTDETEKATALERAKAHAESEQAKALRARLAELAKEGSITEHIWKAHLRARLPKFLHFDEYYQMTGRDNVEALKARVAAGKLKKSDRPLLGLIELARLDLEKLSTTTNTRDLKNTLEGAGNHLSKNILKYWSQNKHLQMRFDVRPGMPEDPEGMTNGTNIWGEVFDSRHLVTTGLDTRSTGFVWFFSFLAWYSAEKNKGQPLVLLLDEPGLSLHGRAQEDLLRYFEAEIASNTQHQLVYTTHSPFMVDPHHYERVRIVQDRGIDATEPLSREQDGTKVFTDILEAGDDSLFPLQSALGYELYQNLFVGPNCLVVEGVSDLLYIQVVSAALQAAGRPGLDSRWTITPVGGSDKVPTFVALIGAKKALRVATLLDFQKSDRQMIENMYKKKLLDQSHVLTYAQFTGTTEADVEDMFDPNFYLGLVSEEYADSLPKALKVEDLKSRAPRIVVKLDEHFAANPLAGQGQFNHYRPARRLAVRTSGPALPSATLDRFQAAFDAVNALLRYS